MNVWQMVLAAVTAYLIGSFPTGVVASKLVNAPDVRYVGSGHTGGTNTMRHAGPWVGATVVIIDALKGLAAWLAAWWLMDGNPWALPLAGTLAVIGHCFPIYTRFHGGMGLATAAGLILILSPWTIIIVVPVWAIFFLLVFRKRYSPRSVAISIPIAVALTLLFLHPAPPLAWMLALVTVVLVLRHLPEWNRVE